MRRTCITLDLPPDRILSNCRIALQQLLVYGDIVSTASATDWRQWALP